MRRGAAGAEREEGTHGNLGTGAVASLVHVSWCAKRAAGHTVSNSNENGSGRDERRERRERERESTSLLDVLLAGGAGLGEVAALGLVLGALAVLQLHLAVHALDDPQRAVGGLVAGELAGLHGEAALAGHRGVHRVQVRLALVLGHRRVALLAVPVEPRARQRVHRVRRNGHLRGRETRG